MFFFLEFFGKKKWKSPDTLNYYTTEKIVLKCIFLGNNFEVDFSDKSFEMHFLREPFQSKKFLMTFSELLYLIYHYSQNSMK